jgi:hypothetical protein
VFPIFRLLQCFPIRLAQVILEVKSASIQLHTN